jgi:hypothetical protein
MHRMKSTTHRQQMVAASSSSRDDYLFLSGDQVKAPAPTRDAASSSAVSQRRGGVPSQRGQFTRKYQAHGKDDLSM